MPEAVPIREDSGQRLPTRQRPGAGIPFDHLLRLSDSTGVLEHAFHTTPRREHGYALDDNARALVVCVRAGHAPGAVPAAVRRLQASCLAFVAHALDAEGRFHNRMSYERRFVDRAGTGDWWGRALWALGVVASTGRAASDRAAAAELFRRAAHQRSEWPRAMAYAALGAAELLAVEPLEAAARSLLLDAGAMLMRPGQGSAGPWPEDRLTYANALWPEGLIAAGTALNDPAMTERGLELLGWLVAVETRGGHLSVTPVGGWAPGEPRPGYDQQPVEVTALAEAAARAYRVTGAPRWREVVALAAAWFTGDNVTGVPMADLATGGGFDGLTPLGRNANQGAESTLALLATMQLAAAVAGEARL